MGLAGLYCRQSNGQLLENREIGRIGTPQNILMLIRSAG